MDLRRALTLFEKAVGRDEGDAMLLLGNHHEVGWAFRRLTGGGAACPPPTSPGPPVEPGPLHPRELTDFAGLVPLRPIIGCMA